MEPTPCWTPGRLIAALEARGDAPAIVTMQGDAATPWPAAAIAGQVRLLATGLCAAGLAPGEAVAIHAPNSPDWIVVRLAIAAAGALPMAIDDLTETAAAEAIIAGAGCRWLFASAAHAAELQRRDGLRVVLVDRPADADGWHALRAAAPGPLPDPAPGDAALIVATSGTTGAPKLFTLTHANLTANLQGVLAQGLIGAGDRMLVPLPLHHVYPFLVGLMTPIAARATIILPEAVTGPLLVQALKGGRATIMIGVPRLYVALLAGLQARIAARGRAAALVFAGLLEVATALRKGGMDVGRRLFGTLHAQMAPELRLMVSGGAKLDAESTWMLEALGWRVASGYGLAETASLFTGNTPAAQRVGSEGRPIAAGTQVRIAQPDALGIGEIELRGPNVFDGYRDNPEANAAAFTTDGWFRTGDLGRVDTDGFLHVTGRSKELIVLGGGKNVMPEEVEAAYAADPAIGEIAVLERDGALVAIVLPDAAALRGAGAARPEDVLRVALTAAAQDLPSYQRLAGYVLAREALPRTRLGKIQRFRLPALYDDLLAGRTAAAPQPLNESDAALVAMPGAAAVWEILKARYPGKPVAPDASPSLDLGIDSLEWLSLAMEIEARTGLRLTEDEMAEMTTIRALLLRASDGAPAPAPRDPALAAAEVAAATTPPSPLVFPLRVAGWAAARGIGRAMFDLRATGADSVPRSGPFVIVANHVSDLDPGLVAAALPFGVARRLWWSGAAERLFVNRVARGFSRTFQVFPVEERAPAQAIAMARAVLAREDGLVWFPESWRSPDGQLQRFLPGIGLVLDGMDDVTVIPAHIAGAFEAMPRDARLPRRHPVRVAFGAPVRAAALRSDAPDARQRAEAVAQALHDLVAEVARGRPPNG
ncbi:AMP-binding protein [Roseomonas fluvialis]|uniref:Long-chain-fatty-acid--CoA ligase n=1 Tax=Roseomonas fluvialis TaxID=1750527 RepID=A0ABM7XZE5_9PROT|nr:AMP-binding protein [Roseomonas fluvialis]BDG70827.1 long-chain-fatty-acid--CoA ligase [Roseomonas fluvialis]